MKKIVNWGRLISLIFLSIMASNIFAEAMPVYDFMQDVNMGTQFKAMDAQLTALGTEGDQWKKMEQQYQDLEREVSKIAEGNFTQSQITSKLKEVDDLIKQASRQDGESYQAGISQFSKNYPGYSAIDDINNGASYDDFYKNNANTTLATLDNSTQAIEQDKANNSGEAVDSTIAQARANILKADGTTQAVSSLAEINIEILKQLQSMHMQLAAMATAQNAAMGKKIQEEATEEAGIREKLDNEAKPVEVNYGNYPVKTPKF